MSRLRAPGLPGIPGAPVRRQRGAFGILYAIMLPVILGLIGLAIDMGRVYARGNELQGAADAAALAAARMLNGTMAGIANARLEAEEILVLNEIYFPARTRRMVWNADALFLGASAQGPWVNAAAVSAAQAPEMLFARFDTARLNPRYAELTMSFLQTVGVVGVQRFYRSAVAGPRASELFPLAVCALSNTLMTVRSNSPLTPQATNMDEVLDHGFRRGVTYNLLNLNPYGTTARSFLVNPLDFPPHPELPEHRQDASLRPFVCTGTAPAPRLHAGAELYVSEPFPTSLIDAVNARFGSAGETVCNRYSGPPDRNVKPFLGGAAYPLANWWMNTTLTSRGSALPSTAGGKLLTIADAVKPNLLDTASADNYGTLWSFGRPQRYDSSGAGEVVLFKSSDWAKLYPIYPGSPGGDLKSTYPVGSSLSPYERNIPDHSSAPAGLTGIAERRILTVPLLDCAKPIAGKADMLALGRFLLVAPAQGGAAPAIHAEFGGLSKAPTPTASVALYQ